MAAQPIFAAVRQETASLAASRTKRTLHYRTVILDLASPTGRLSMCVRRKEPPKILSRAVHVSRYRHHDMLIIPPLFGWHRIFDKTLGRFHFSLNDREREGDTQKPDVYDHVGSHQRSLQVMSSTSLLRYQCCPRSCVSDCCSFTMGACHRLAT